MPESGDVLITGKLGEILDQIAQMKELHTRDGSYDLFGPHDTFTFERTMECALIFTSGYEELDWLPEYARERDWADICMGEIIEQVIDNAKEQKPDVTVDELIACLNYYMDFDAFMDLSDGAT